MSKERIDRRLRQLEELAERTIQTNQALRGHVGGNVVDSVLYTELRTSTISFILSVLGNKHPYYTELADKFENATATYARRIIGVLKGLRGELDNGWLDDMRGIVAAEVFTDFMEMAEHLLGEGYHDPAAVIIGSVLEGHLRTLSTKHGLPIAQVKDGKQVPIKADTLNAALSKAGVYNLIRQKAITAWLDIRNNAAHGNYQEYTKEQVKIMYLGVLDFLS
jgi:hypothetical protein